MRKIQIVSLIILISIMSLNNQISVEGEETKPTQLYSKACALMDGESGRILFGKEEQTPLANASTTKILTCIVALENGEMDGVVKASANASGQPKVHLGMKVGEEFYLKDLLYGLMLESFNDCAVAIAEHIAGTTEDFARLMNDKASEIGCKDSYFITPNGLDAKDDNGVHHTTAEDLCRIMRYCCWGSPKNKEFLEITETPAYSFQNIAGRNFSCNNHNAFLNMMDGMISGKTGFTGDAGYCYVAALEKDGKKYCIALLACGWPNNRTYKWKDAKVLLQYGLNNYQIQNIYKNPKLPEITVVNGKRIKQGLEGWGKSVKIEPYAALDAETKLNYLISKEDKVEIKVIMDEEPVAPIKKEDVLGKIQVLLNGEKVKEYRIISSDQIGKWSFLKLFMSILSEYLCLHNC